MLSYPPMAMQEIAVTLPSGAPFIVLTDEERDYFEQLVAGYEEGFAFQHPSDVADLDKIIGFELMIHRWQAWLAANRQYDNEKIDPLDLQKRCKENSTEVRQLKKSLGVDAISRNKASGKGSVPFFIEALVQRAEAFGIMRNDQFDKALELANELIGLADWSLNCTPEEQRKFGIDADGLRDWIVNVFKPEFQQIDLDFQQNQQRMWIREQ